MRPFCPWLLAASLVLCGCAKTARAPEECPKLYTILPDNFVIDLAAGSEVVINPAMQEFALFCSRDMAKEALAKSGVAGWRVYSLKGGLAELAEPAPGAGRRFRLTAPAQVDDWIGD